jgi:hypothetical protein
MRIEMPKKKKEIYHLLSAKKSLTTTLCGTPLQRCENVLNIMQADLVRKSETARLCHKCKYTLKLKRNKEKSK